MIEYVIVILLLVTLFYFYNGKVVSENMESGSESSYIKLYDNFEYKGSPAYSKVGPTEMKYAIKAQIKSVDIKVVDKDSYVELWNVREGQTLASSVSDFYTNTIYTTPSYLRGVSPNLKLIARVYGGEHFKSNNLPIIHRLMIVAHLK